MVFAIGWTRKLDGIREVGTLSIKAHEPLIALILKTNCYLKDVAADFVVLKGKRFGCWVALAYAVHRHSAHVRGSLPP